MFGLRTEREKCWKFYNIYCITVFALINAQPIIKIIPIHRDVGGHLLGATELANVMIYTHKPSVSVYCVRHLVFSNCLVVVQT